MSVDGGAPGPAGADPAVDRGSGPEAPSATADVTATGRSAAEGSASAVGEAAPGPAVASEAPASTGPSGGRVVFVGAGPGAADLITLRGARALGAADVVVWPRSLVPPEVMEHARADAEVLTSDDHTLEDVIQLFARAKREGLTVCRLQSGDPAIYATLHEQINACRRMDLPYEIVPGVGSLSAMAAALGQELTVPEVAQSLILTRRAVRVPMPDNERLQELAGHGTTMALYLSVRRPRELVADLLAGGYAPETPVAIGYRVSWPDERLLRCRLDELAATLKEHRITTQALIVLGPGLAAGEEERRSHVYRPNYGHRYRRLGSPRRYRDADPETGGAVPSEPGSPETP